MKFTRIHITCLIGIWLIFLSAVTSHAITITATPQPARVNQPVTFIINALFEMPSSCTIEVNFGDGFPWQDAGVCSSTSCTLTVSHAYEIPGVYKVRARSKAGACDTAYPPAPPDPASIDIMVLCEALTTISPSALPEATEGQPYSYQIQATGGVPPLIYSIRSGNLLPGLSLSPGGLLSGVPSAGGTYGFTVGVTDSCPLQQQYVTKEFSLVVKAVPTTVSVSVTPSSINVPRGQASSQMLRYTFSGAPQSLQLNSQKGLFIANDRVIGENNTPLNVFLQDGSGSVSETITIPVAVLKRAEALGTTRLQYLRSFTGQSVSVVATVEINVTTGALAEFRIDRVQLYFENGRAEITVRRNQPNLRAYADIRFTGSGILRGYWEVDGRLLSNVNKHLVYGRTVTIPSPEVPSLPTFVSGTHIVRFVITEPSQEIPLPVAVYFVTAEEYRKALSIRLLSPENNTEVGYSSLTFSWEGVSGLTAYLVEFMEKEGEKALFSAYTRKTEYTLPDRFLKRIFRPGSSYVWKVKGFGSENTIIAESPLYRFTFKERATYFQDR